MSLDFLIKLQLVVLVTTADGLTQGEHITDNIGQLTEKRGQNKLYERVEVSGASSYRGWGLEVNTCLDFESRFNNSLHPCQHKKVLAKDGYMLAVEEVEKHPSPRDEGLALTVLNQRNGKPIFHKIFSLQYYWSFWSDLQWHLYRISPGRVVALSFSVTGAIGLRNATQTLKLLGSTFVNHLHPNSTWLWCYIQDGKTLSESVVINGRSEIHTSTILELRSTESSKINSSKERNRWDYCEYNGGMGGLCNEYMPDDFMYTSPVRLPFQKAISNVPIIISAGSRIQYLYFTLYKLLRTPGVVKENVLVVLGNSHPATLQLVQLMNLNYKQVPPVHIEENYVLNSANQKLFLYYRKVFELASKLYSTAPAAIFMDEDVEVSPDFLSYISQTLRLLYEDPTLYCINGYTQIGLHGLAHHPSRIYRGNVQVQWGYAVTLNFIRESLEMWPKNGTTKYFGLYDFWLHKTVAGDRECVFPEVGRTKHYGMGINLLPLIAEKSFVKAPLLNSSGIYLPDVGTLELSLWRKDLENSIKKSTFLEGNPCKEGFLPQPTTPSNYTFFYYRSGFDEYNIITKCFRTWDFSMTGDHEGVTTISPALNVHIFLIAYPQSAYTHLKPKHVQPFDIDLYSDNDYWHIKDFSEKIELDGLEDMFIQNKFIKKNKNNTLTASLIKDIFRLI